MMTWWFTTFMAPAIKQKVHNLPGVEYLYEIMSPDQLEVPAYVTEYDMTVGLHTLIMYLLIPRGKKERSNTYFCITDKWT